MKKDEYVLLIDAGGTYVKAALAKNKKIISKKIIETNDFKIDDIKKFVEVCKNSGKEISSIIIACAGPVKDGKCKLANAALSFDERSLNLVLGIRVRIINDLEAAAYFLKKSNKNALLIGLGTGLGVSLIDGKGDVAASEEGHLHIDKELFMSVPELRNTIIPQYENILGAKKNILIKLLKMNAKEIKLEDIKKDRFTEIYFQVLESFVERIISAHTDIKIKKIIFLGGVSSSNQKILEKYSAAIKNKFKVQLEIMDDKFTGVYGALVFYCEKQKSL